MSFNTCSLQAVLGNNCGASRGLVDLVLLTECDDDVSAHLASCHLSKENLNERELILARAGLFDLTKDQVGKMKICPRHRHLLGRFWRAPKSCQYPDHTGKSTTVGGRHVVNLKLAREVKYIFHQNVFVGAPLCTTCRKKHCDRTSAHKEWLRAGEKEEANVKLIPKAQNERTAKHEAISAISQVLSSTPFRESQTPQARRPDSCWTAGLEDATPYSIRFEAANDALSTYNSAMKDIASQVVGETHRPLASQMNVPWEKATKAERSRFLEKAREDCLLVCKSIAPKNGEELYRSLVIDRQPSEELKLLMEAYRNAKSKTLRTQILSLYVCSYSASTLKEIHLPYGKLSDWQIKQARSHAKIHGPGTEVVKDKKNRIRLDMTKVDHFIEFVNRPYFYQDVAYGSKVLKLDNGEKIEMPNVVRTVTRSTMIFQYLEFCKEEQCEPLSRSTLFKILEVREASQRKSLQGLDNTAADGAAAFQTIEGIVNDLEKGGKDKVWCGDVKKKLRDAKRYLKTDYRVNCKPDDSVCADHCRRFALSDKISLEFKKSCSHQHTERCEECEALKKVLQDVEAAIQGKYWTPYSQDQRDDLLFDYYKAKSDIFQWKAHILRSIHQNIAKQDALKNISSDSAMVVMDWAMKFLQLKYREKQSDWYGKRGLSWHISTIITMNAGSESLELKSYAHVFDSCKQDWFAVCSVIENLLKVVKADNPQIKSVYLRSDEAGCYQNNSLVAALRDIGERVGISVLRFDHSEPQYGKDICDRILCPMKSSIRRYCDEGHDIVSADDMRTALFERPVKGTSASVCSIDGSKGTLEVVKIDGFSMFHNFEYEDDGVRVWKAYGIGPGKLIPYKNLFTKHLGSTDIMVHKDFFPFRDTRLYQSTRESTKEHTDSEDEANGLFPCSEPGCHEIFKTFSDLEAHFDIGNHVCKKKETTYDKLRRDWAMKFSTVDKAEEKQLTSAKTSVAAKQRESKPEECGEKMGWALHNPRVGGTRFSENVKNYLTARFDIGERTGNKADAAQVAADMRKARDENNVRLFGREEWLTKSQVGGFFSRLAATRRKRANLNENIDSKDALAEEQEIERQNLLMDVQNELGLQHPICYDSYSLCDYANEQKLNKFNVDMLKAILRNFEVSFSYKDRKKDLIQRLSSFLEECTCFSEKQ